MLGKKPHKALGPLVHVDLIPVEREFVRRVIAQGVSCTVRDTRGRRLPAACGQLAAEG